jgi:branched-chain amino acid transport system ATP-binding protein
MTASPSIIQISQLKVNYGQIKAVKGVDLSFESSKITTLIGCNGAGKTSVLKSVIGLIPSTGSIKLDQTELNQLTTIQRLKNKITLCPEGRGIFPNLTVLENLQIGAYLNPDSKKIQELIEHQFSFFPKLKDRQKQTAGTLSGGEQQMLAISRALMSEPKFLMLDEPSLGLAPVIIEQIFEKFLQLKNEGLGLLIVEQNASLALEISDQAFVLETGLIHISGPGQELLNDSRVREAYLS